MQHKKLIIFIIILAAVVGFYGWYVRGVGSRGALRHVRPADPALGVWASRKPMPTARTEVAAAELGGKIYVAGGLDGFGRTLAVVESYDPERDEWSSCSSLPQGVHHTVLVSAFGYLYALGGFTDAKNTPTDSVWVFDGATCAWTQAAPLPIARGAHAAVAVSGYLFAVGGVGKSGLLEEVDRYDPATNTWSQVDDFPHPRDHLAAAVMQDKIYVVGGRKESLRLNQGMVDIYDPATDSWSVGPFLPTPRGGIAAAVLDQKLLVIGGEKIRGTLDTVEALDPTLQLWRRMNPMPTARHGLGVAVLGNKMYLLGGGRKPGLSISDVNEVLSIVQ